MVLSMCIAYKQIRRIHTGSSVYTRPFCEFWKASIGILKLFNYIMSIPQFSLLIKCYSKLFLLKFFTQIMKGSYHLYHDPEQFVPLSPHSIRYYFIDLSLCECSISTHCYTLITPSSSPLVLASAVISAAVIVYEVSLSTSIPSCLLYPTRFTSILPL